VHLNSSIKQYSLVFLHKESFSNESLQQLKKKVFENFVLSVSPIWKQMNFMNNKDMLKFLERMRTCVHFKIDKITNKFSFEKKSANEFTVNPLDFERVKGNNLEVNKVSIEFYHWDSNIEIENKLKQRLFREYEKYRMVYQLKRNRQSFQVPRQLIICKCSQLELFHTLSVSTNTDQFLGEETTEMRVEMSEIKKHLNVLFSRKVLAYAQASFPNTDKFRIFFMGHYSKFKISPEYIEKTYITKTHKSNKYFHRLIAAIPTFHKDIRMIFPANMETKEYLENFFIKGMSYMKCTAFTNKYLQTPEQASEVHQHQEMREGILANYKPLIIEFLRLTNKIILLENDNKIEKLKIFEVGAVAHF
jgi:hypothetical protein